VGCARLLSAAKEIRALAGDEKYLRTARPVVMCLPHDLTCRPGPSAQPPTELAVRAPLGERGDVHTEARDGRRRGVNESDCIQLWLRGRQVDFYDVTGGALLWAQGCRSVLRFCGRGQAQLQALLGVNPPACLAIDPLYADAAVPSLTVDTAQHRSTLRHHCNSIEFGAIT
jgi:hypothetical protein